jgi:membrane-associated phospholipid phosphatase
MKLAEIRDSNRGRAMLLGYCVFCVFYMSAQYCAFRDPVSPPFLAVDREIPFMARSIWLYGSHFLFVFLSLWLVRDEQRLDRVFYSMMLGTVLAFVFFLLYPTELAVQKVSGEGPTGWLWTSLQSVDKPRNCFPSLHCCLATLGALSLSSRGWGWRILAGLWAGGIAFSTLATKQHVLVDVIGGVVLALISYLLLPIIFSLLRCQQEESLDSKAVL